MRNVPTSHVPGSPEKIEVMRRRALWRWPLFHPEDIAAEVEQRLVMLCKTVSTRGVEAAAWEALEATQRQKALQRIKRD